MQQDASHTNAHTPVLLALVFFGGFANLATEIIGPRMFASMFGNATAIWAVIISVTLVGLSVGYAMGGRIPAERAPRVLPTVLVINALWLLAVSWLVWGVPGASRFVDFALITTTAMIAFFPPSVLFGMLTPLAITLTSQGHTHDETTTIVGNLYALGTIGSVLGALSAAFFWIPWVGLSLSLRIFAGVLVLFAGYFLRGQRPVVAVFALLTVVVLFPQPRWVWSNDEDLRLLAQREGYYQTVRVYTDDESFVQMHLGPTFQSRMDIETREPAFNYARTMMELADAAVPEMAGARALVLGGAGHTMAHALENRGATVTEVEIDPVVVAMSDAYFGEIDGEVITADARVYINTAPDDTFDLILFDAFDSGTGIPPQLTTQEFYAHAARVLTEDGVMIANFVGTPTGRQSGAYRAVSSTMSSAFPQVGAFHTRENNLERQNIILVGSFAPLPALDLVTVPEGGRVLTDDYNPVEILFERARDGFYFRR